jgi:hypothetical protein
MEGLVRSMMVGWAGCGGPRNHQVRLHFKFYLETNSGRLVAHSMGPDGSAVVDLNLTAKYTLQDSTVTWKPRDGMQREESRSRCLKEQHDFEGTGIGHRIDDEG